MRSLTFVVAAAAMLATATPALAQLGLSDSFDFISAVEKRDGGKADQLLSNHPTIIDSRDGKGDTALIIALNRGDSDWVGFLLNKGANPNLASTKSGDTPLIAAARIGLQDAAEWLLNLGAKVDGTNRQGETPLIVAVQLRQVQMIRFLLAHGANPDKVDSAQGYSARQYAERDTRSRQILQLIEARKPKPAAVK
ncbi:MAG TPA: ankyrin repeat domain-containing protein [Sphingomicrobium sp.]|nr:ankyrin repeat domain-containing protein [Sphingomicrobium sp.]